MTEQGDDAPQRDDKDDHDLLTYSEAAVRLYEEIETLRLRVKQLGKAGESEALTKTQARLAVLEGARDRNSRQPINDDNFEKFFGYKGAARRNV
ncbi:acyl-CoA synthase [Rhodococcoides yunnanense]|uniref:Acyl-CoA synthase n=1 Tax=Rhodococcoides yunnanense TaxID=278209 RepID=A0ABU4BKG2_9NOCA|nr:acyl-CoA synthase [Rhodococcus yunnanensis]MDV6264709.1 acyl-CoA synthase [Rhodococcus yunnanensis]